MDDPRLAQWAGLLPDVVLAQRFGLHYNTILRYRNKNGIKKHRPIGLSGRMYIFRWYTQTSWAEMADAFDLERRLVTEYTLGWARRRELPWPPEMATLVQLEPLFRQLLLEGG